MRFLLKSLNNIRSILKKSLSLLVLRHFYNYQPNNVIIIAIGFSAWKKKFVRSYFKDSPVIFANHYILIRVVAKLLLNYKLKIVVWSFKDQDNNIDLSAFDNLSIWRMEDGFIRSVGLGVDHVMPWSLCIDSKGAHFDGSTPSDLEDLINKFDCTKLSSEQKQDASRLLSKLQDFGICKYNIIAQPHYYSNREVDGTGILVLGQVENDQSILRNPSVISTNAELLERAIADHPDTEIYFKQHPDCLSNRGRPGYVDVNAYSGVKEVPISVSIANAICNANEVYTISSLGGFEALLKGKRVTTFGAPFYAGWGLTNDQMNFSRRMKTLTIEELLYIAYVEYATYFNPISGDRLTVHQVVDIIIEHQQNQIN
ncbi:capsular polysaccharide export protein [Pseudovibrio denitrificans]|uniref:Capsular polysaccharide export protein n=1 Tax=Pseudovibrio denitrificans TaxID=258256 RepID=A0A1I7CU21_9HYPH|nr:capsular polysaccharide export protein [Pseudovibrio denitrificans]